jgi:hypothetical protein
MVKEESTMPGREIPKEYREVVAELVRNQGWRYDNSRSGHPIVLPADTSFRSFAVPTTPGDSRSFKNWVGQVRRSGGHWPPTPREKR